MGKHSLSILMLSALYLSTPYTAYCEDNKDYHDINHIDTLTVTANPFQRSNNNLIQPVTMVRGDELAKQNETTIGSALGNEPGIRSSDFGPNAARPVIRGLASDQINILQNGVNNLDVSAISDDHNIAIDPLSLERIEVIRGPSALLYGSKAVGGVVNLIDNRIPSEPIGVPITGVLDGRFNSANKERSGAFLLQGGTDEFAWHINGFKRRTADELKIPGFARSDRLRQAEPKDEEEYARLGNTQNKTEGVTLGFSKFFDQGYVGLAYSHYNSEYGIIGHSHEEEHDDDDDNDDHHHEEEASAFIDMEQNRLDFAAEYRNPFKHFKKVNYKIGLSDYNHQEVEDGTVGTTFKNRGFDSRLELTHNEIKSFNGLFGLQFGRSDFEALGDEAFVPISTTTTLSAFALEERCFEDFDINFGGRLDFQDIETDTSAAFTSKQSRDDFTGSASIGVLYHLPHHYKIALSTAYTQRAPTAQELYANGEHVATSTFEVGDPNLDMQKSIGVDLGLRKTRGTFRGEVNLFYNHFTDFITLSPTGNADAEGNPILNFTNLPAEIYGLEFKANTTAYNQGKNQLDFEIRGDYLQGRNRNTGNNLPRIAPMRLGGSTIYRYNYTTLRLDTDYTFAQTDTAPNELATDGFTMLNFGINQEINLGEVSSLFYIKATNLLNEEARNHVSFLKDQTPLAGRSIMVGLRSNF